MLPRAGPYGEQRATSVVRRTPPLRWPPRPKARHCGNAGARASEQAAPGSPGHTTERCCKEVWICVAVQRGTFGVPQEHRHA